MAFRIIREFMQAPTFIVTCDHPNGCGECTSAPVPDEAPGTQVAFLQAVSKAGWKLLLSHRCPQHYALEKADEQRVIVPGMELVGGGRKN